MNAVRGVIRVSNLRLRTYIGFNPEERSKQQDVVINLEIHHRVAAQAAEYDRVDAALDYKVITKAVIAHVEAGRFLLLEKLVHDLLGICTRDAAVFRAVVTVDKPHALRFADSVSLTLAWDQDTSQTESENANESHVRRFSKAS